VDQLGNQLRVQGIPAFGPVQGDGVDSAGFFD
jgi:hypothetical protein